MSKQFKIQPGGQIKGEIIVPGDKSISHRSLMLGAIADGVTKVSGFLQGEDTLATLAAFRQMGVEIEQKGTNVVINGVGLNGLKQPKEQLYLGNSGTSVRLMSGLLSGQDFAVEMVGDESLMKRPMKRVVNPLKEMGANIECTESGNLPIKTQAKDNLQGIDFTMPVASAQLKSALILAGLYAETETKITEPETTRDHTECMLDAFGHPVERVGKTITVTPATQLQATEINVPGDISSATFFIVAASITPNSELLINNVGINPTRHAVLEILKLMGANIELRNERKQAGEAVADIYIKSADLKGIQIPEALVPIAIDEFPAILIAAANAEGVTELTGAEELRVKESDRLAAMANGLRACGVELEEREDGMRLVGGQMQGAEIDSYTDHRIAMAFAVAGLTANGEMTINDCDNVATSFPNFVELANSVGMSITSHG